MQLDDRDMDVVGPLLLELERLERQHSRLRMQWQEARRSFESQEADMMGGILEARARLDALLAGMKGRYAEIEGQDLIFNVDQAMWVPPASR